MDMGLPLGEAAAMELGAGREADLGDGDDGRCVVEDGGSLPSVTPSCSDADRAAAEVARADEALARRLQAEERAGWSWTPPARRARKKPAVAAVREQPRKRPRRERPGPGEPGEPASYSTARLVLAAELAGVLAGAPAGTTRERAYAAAIAAAEAAAARVPEDATVEAFPSGSGGGGWAWAAEIAAALDGGGAGGADASAPSCARGALAADGGLRRFFAGGPRAFLDRFVAGGRGDAECGSFGRGRTTYADALGGGGGGSSSSSSFTALTPKIDGELHAVLADAVESFDGGGVRGAAREARGGRRPCLPGLPPVAAALYDAYEDRDQFLVLQPGPEGDLRPRRRRNQSPVQDGGPGISSDSSVSPKSNSFSMSLGRVDPKLPEVSTTDKQLLGTFVPEALSRVEGILKKFAL